MEIISRARWGAVHDRGFRDAPLPAEEVWLHHSVTLAPDLKWVDVDKDGVEDDEERAMRLLEQIGENRFGGGISYTFPIMPSGRIYEGHGVERQGAHTGGRNDRARAIVFVGDYGTRAPTEAQITSAAWLLQEGVRRGWWKKPRINGGHRQVPGASTACPGDAAMRAIAKINALAAGAPIGEDDEMNAYQQRVLIETQRRVSNTLAVVVENQARLTAGFAAVQQQLATLIAGEAKDLTAVQAATMINNAVNNAVGQQAAEIKAALAEVDRELEELAAQQQQ